MNNTGNVATSVTVQSKMHVKPSSPEHYEERRTVQAMCLELAIYSRLMPYIVAVNSGVLEKLAGKHLPTRLHWIRKNYFIQSPEHLLDKLGIDILVEINGVRMAIDVTTARHNVLQTKATKMHGVKKFLEELGGFTPVILRCLNDSLPANLEMLLLDNVRTNSFMVNQINTVKIQAKNYVFKAKSSLQ